MSKSFPVRRVLIVPLAVLLVGLAALAGWKTVRVVEVAGQLRREGTQTVALLRELQKQQDNTQYLVALGPAMERTTAALSAFQAEVRPLEFLLRATRPLPSQVNWLADVPDLLAVGVPLLQAGTTVVRPFSEAAIASETAPKQEQLRLYLAAAGSLGPQIPQLTQQIDTVETALQPLRGRPLGGPMQPLGPLLDRSGEMLALARQGLELLGAAGPALGMDSPRTYLLLGQNNAEIRATGGFIGSMGAVTLDRGAVVRLEYGSSYTPDEGVTPIAPPWPFARYLGLGGWYLRDANWWPDFPASAAQVEQAWLRAGRDPIDGVIALDTTTVETLLRLVGPVEVEGYGAVSVDDFERTAAEQLYSGTALATYTSFQQAKNAFLGATSRALVDRLLTLSPADALPLGEGLLQLLREKHLLLAFKDQRLLQLVHANGWDGAMPAPDGDSLYVVDTTVSYGDTYPYVTSDDALTVNVAEDGSQYHELVLNYKNIYPQGVPSWLPLAMLGGATFDPATAKVTDIPGFWGNWLRIYLPPDAKVVSCDGLVDPLPPQPEFQRVVVAGYLPMHPGEGRAVRLRYVTTGAQGQSGEGYRLLLQKQPGLEGRPISVEVKWPDGKTALYRGRPKTDLEIKLRAGDIRNEGLK